MGVSAFMEVTTQLVVIVYNFYPGNCMVIQYILCCGETQIKRICQLEGLAAHACTDETKARPKPYRFAFCVMYWIAISSYILPDHCILADGR